jgi:hypothetical protein
VTVFTAAYDYRTRRVGKMELSGTETKSTFFRYDGGDSFQEFGWWHCWRSGALSVCHCWLASSATARTGAITKGCRGPVGAACAVLCTESQGGGNGRFGVRLT